MTEPDDLAELAAWLADNIDRVPAHRRLQALRHLERAEALVPAQPVPHADSHTALTGARP